MQNRQGGPKIVAWIEGQPVSAMDQHTSEQFARQLFRGLPPGLVALLYVIAAQAEGLGVDLYIIGGFVRDLLVGRLASELDLVVEGDAISLARSLAAHYGGSVEPHTPFGTASWMLAPHIAEMLNVLPEDLPEYIHLASTRLESYPEPGALPTVQLTAPHPAEHRKTRPISIQEDVSRRDFTVNTLGIQLAPPPFRVRFDANGGMADLRAGLIRVLHDRSFIDDPTRMFRAVRFEQRLGFQIEPHTEALIRQALPVIAAVSGPRLRHELDLILAEATPVKVLSRLDSLGILAAIDSGLIFDESLRFAFTNLQPVFAANRQSAQMLAPGWSVEHIEPISVYWTLLLCRVDAATLERLTARLQLLRADVANAQGGQQACEALPELARGDAAPSRVTHLLEGIPDPALLAAYALAPNDAARERIASYAVRWRHVRPALQGDTLKAMGLKPGPRFGTLLRRLRDAKLDGLVATPDQERALLEQIVRDEA